LRGGNGIQLIKDFRKLDGAVATLVLSAQDDALSIQRALRAGARGYLTMDDAAVEILKALDEVSAGHRYISANMLPQLIEHFVTGKIDRVTSELHSLSDRELEIFSLMGKGLARMEVAMELHTSPKTIETHQIRIRDKLALRGIPQVREKAAQWIAKCARDRLHRRSQLGSQRCNGARHDA
jgi:DNA-binding NarL/FixJ family response regulator